MTVAASYGTFAVVQLLKLWLFSRQQIDVPFAEDSIDLTFGALIFLLTDEMLYTQIDRDKYRRIFAGVLAISDLVLVARSLSLEP